MSKNVWIWNHYGTDMYKNRGGRHFWFAEELLKRGYAATIFCANTYHNTNANEFIDIKKGNYTIDNVKDIPFVFVKTKIAVGNGIDRFNNMLLFYFNLFSVSKKYAKLNEKPDIIVASSVHPLTMVAGIKIANKLGIPCICEIRDLWPEAIFSFGKLKESSLFGKVLVEGEHWIYKNSDALIFTKQGDVDYLKEKKWDSEQGGDINLEKCFYINNGVDIKTFDYNKLHSQFEEEDTGKFNVTYVGSIRPVNNVDSILDVALMLKDHSDIQFLIYGEGSQKKHIQNRIMIENISNVKLKGFINKNDVPYVLSKSSVNLLNYSRTQYNWSRGNSSNKLFEYMASGKPIISNVKMGYSILERYNCGIELESESINEFAEAILKIKNMSKTEYESLSNNARNGALDFDFNKLTTKLIDVINFVS